MMIRGSGLVFWTTVYVSCPQFLHQFALASYEIHFYTTL